jgi:predicted permease
MIDQQSSQQLERDAVLFDQFPKSETGFSRQDAIVATIGSFLEGLWRDLRNTIRILSRKPLLVAVSAVSLGLGIGVNTVLYMAINRIYGHQPTIAEPQRLVGIELANANQFSYTDYKDLLASGIFQDALGFRMTAFSLGPRGETTRAGATITTGNYFKVLGVTAALGRTFSNMDVRPETEPRVVVVTNGFWRNYLRGRLDVIGQSLILDGEPFRVIGVLPKSYQAVSGWADRGIYVPLSKFTFPKIYDRETPSLTVLGRLSPGTSLRQTEQAIIALNATFERTYPNRLKGQPAAVFPASELQFRGAPAQLLLMKIAWATAISVLLISCVNVTGLLLARATDRQSEMAIRGALGAGRVHIIRAMLVESFLLVLGGASLGLPIALLLNLIPLPAEVTPIQDAMALDYRVVPYSVVLIGFATLVCGVTPTIRVMRLDLSSQLNQAGRQIVTQRTWLRETLVGAQIALTFVLIVAALLCIRGQAQIAHVDFGFDIDHGVVAQLQLPPTQYPGQERVRLAERLTRRIEQIPGVASVSVADLVPLGGNALIKSFHPAGRTDIPGTRPDSYSVGPGYFRTLGIRLISGREFDASDREGASPVVVVNETYAKTYFSGKDALSRAVQTVDEPDSRIVGVVRDNRIDTIGERPRSVIYYSFLQRPGELRIHVRCAVAPGGLVTVIQQVIRGVDGTIPFSVETLHSATNLELTMRRAGVVLMGVLGGVGLLLAIVGLYGSMAYAAASRTGDVAIRMALGASPNRVRWEMLRRTLFVVLPSVAVGVAVSLAIMPFFGTFLAGVSPYDPVSFGGAMAIFVLAGLAAGYMPAHRNARLDPLQALRQQ